MSLEKVLDRALAGQPSDEPEIDSLVAVARELQHTFAVEPASWARERQMFVAGVAARRRGPHLARFLVPALAVLLVVMVGLAGRVALPGNTLYPVRQALQRVGLATSPWEAVDKDIARATRYVEAAEGALDRGDLVAAEQSAAAAITRLGRAQENLAALEGTGSIDRTLLIETLRDHAEEVIAAVERAEDTPDPSDRGPEPGRKGDDDEDEEGGDDDDDDDDGNSGPGGDDGDGEATDGDDGGDGGDGDDGNSGPGGGDDDGDDAETLDGDDGDDADAETLDGDEENDDVEDLDD